MTLKLNGSSSGSVSIDAPASTTSGADVALTLPVDDGDAGQVLKTNGSGALSWTTPGLVFTQTAEITLPTDASSYTWTGIPQDWKKLRLHLCDADIANNATVTLGTYTSGYMTAAVYVSSGNAKIDSTAGFKIYGGSDISGVMEFAPMDVTGMPDKYIGWHSMTNGTTSTRNGAGHITGVTGWLTQLVFTHDSGNFGGGTACISYEVPAS